MKSREEAAKIADRFRRDEIKEIREARAAGHDSAAGTAMVLASQARDIAAAIRALPAVSVPVPTNKPLDDTALRGSVEITVFRGGKLLAVNSRNFGGFCGVGGKVELGESFEQAARRELMEETGCEARSITFVAGHTLDPIPGDDQSVKWYCAGFVVDIGEQEPRQNEEGTIPFWTTKEDMIQNSLFPEWYEWWFGVLDKFAAPSPSAEAIQDAVKEIAPLLDPWRIGVGAEQVEDIIRKHLGSVTD